MTVGIYNPYHDTLGGGEKYMLSFANYFLSKKDVVEYFGSNSQEIEKAGQRFSLDVSGLNSAQAKKYYQGLDVLLFYSDGSIPYSLAKKTYLIFQFPVPWVKRNAITELIKKHSINGYIVNSMFTKSYIDATFGVKSTVVYPSISIDQYHVGEKRKQILSVGRFTKGMNTKRHDVMIQAFKMLIDNGLKDWELILIGGVRDEDHDMVNELKEHIVGYPIQLFTNIDRKELLTHYSSAMVYWHAAGYQVNVNKNPESVEHFGISTLEAMASGCVPLIYPAGGQPEIVRDNTNGLYWLDVKELAVKTLHLIDDKKQFSLLQTNAVNSSRAFDEAVFLKQLSTIFG